MMLYEAICCYKLFFRFKHCLLLTLEQTNPSCEPAQKRLGMPCIHISQVSKRIWSIAHAQVMLCKVPLAMRTHIPHSWRNKIQGGTHPHALCPEKWTCKLSHKNCLIDSLFYPPWYWPLPSQPFLVFDDVNLVTHCFQDVLNDLSNLQISNRIHILQIW